MSWLHAGGCGIIKVHIDITDLVLDSFTLNNAVMKTKAPNELDLSFSGTFCLLLRASLLRWRSIAVRHASCAALQACTFA